jgi:hypothetical protein
MTSEEEEENENSLQKEVKLYHSKNIPVAVEMKNGYKYSGEILDCESADFFEIKDWKMGIIPLFYRQVRIVVPAPKKNNAEEEGYYHGGGYKP